MGYSGKTHYTDSQNSDTTAPSARELYHLLFSFQTASPETFGYTFICYIASKWKITLNDAMKKTWKEVVVNNFKVLYRLFLAGLRKAAKKTKSTSFLRIGNRTLDPPGYEAGVLATTL
jgi:hypothetical protein